MKRTALSRKTPLRPKAKRHKPGAKCHMAKVAQLPCVICGAPCEEVHHCRHMPTADENNGQGPYVQLPCAGRKSSDFDTIPLCARDHADLHANKRAWREAHGPDYGFLEAVRALVAGL